ncbi:hypothetical protein VTO42DRAFT_9074 [Malbranchea cinnamomea]
MLTVHVDAITTRFGYSPKNSIFTLWTKIVGKCYQKYPVLAMAEADYLGSVCKCYCVHHFSRRGISAISNTLRVDLHVWPFQHANTKPLRSRCMSCVWTKHAWNKPRFFFSKIMLSLDY